MMVHRAALLLTLFPSATKPPPNPSENSAKLILSPFLTKNFAAHFSASRPRPVQIESACGRSKQETGGKQKGAHPG
jgi:hypothetical protein